MSKNRAGRLIPAERENEMAKFTKYNNPSKKRKERKHTYSNNYYNERKNELYNLLAEAKTEAERDALIKAFNVSMNP